MIPMVTGKNLFDGWVKTNDQIFFNEEETVDFMRPGVSAHSFHNYIRFDSCEKPPELWQMGFKKTKWSMLLRLYFDPDELGLLINRLKFYRAETRGKKYVPDIGMAFKSRQNRSGACLLGLTVRFSRKCGWEVEVFSRASEMTSRWAVDLAFLYVLIKEIGKHLDFKPREVTLHWNGAGMYQSILTAPLYLKLSGQEDIFKDLHPNQVGSLSPWQKAVYDRWLSAFATDTPKYQKYKSQRRSTYAYQWIQDNSPPEVNGIIMVKDLKLPPYSLDIEEDFFRRKGFR
jgi:hypothetical protein